MLLLFLCLDVVTPEQLHRKVLFMCIKKAAKAFLHIRLRMLEYLNRILMSRKDN